MTSFKIFILCCLCLFGSSKTKQNLTFSRQSEIKKHVLTNHRGLKNVFKTRKKNQLNEDFFYLHKVQSVEGIKNNILDSNEMNSFVGNWYDGDNCWLNIEAQNDTLNISYYAGPCEGTLIGVSLKGTYELKHQYSQCNFKEFKNDHILGRKIGYVKINNGQLILDLTIGDELLKTGGQIFDRFEY